MLSGGDGGAANREIGIAPVQPAPAAPAEGDQSSGGETTSLS